MSTHSVSSVLGPNKGRERRVICAGRLRRAGSSLRGEDNGESAFGAGRLAPHPARQSALADASAGAPPSPSLGTGGGVGGVHVCVVGRAVPASSRAYRARAPG